MHREPTLKQPARIPSGQDKPALTPKPEERRAPARETKATANIDPSIRRRKAMNKTESAFSLRLEADIADGSIESWHFEGITLRWGTLDSISYTPDFAVFRKDGSILLIETKGGHLFAATTQKFKAARNQWPQFEFQMWQRKKGQWNQLFTIRAASESEG